MTQTPIRILRRRFDTFPSRPVLLDKRAPRNHSPFVGAAIMSLSATAVRPEWHHNPVNLARCPRGMNFRFSSFGIFRASAFVKIRSLNTVTHALHGPAGSRRDGLFFKHAEARMIPCCRKLNHRNSMTSIRRTLKSSTSFRSPNGFASSSHEMVWRGPEPPPAAYDRVR